MLDLEPAAREMVRLLAEVRADQLTARTPCEKYSLGDLIDHVGGLAFAFTAAATKTPMPDPKGPLGDASRLEPGWSEQISDQLDRLVSAWREPDAWEGMTRVGGVDLPGGVAGNIAQGELIIHGWDLATASGQEYALDPEILAAFLDFAQKALDPSDRPAEGPFGPAVDVPADAPVLDRVIALSGRNPAWTPPGADVS